MKILATLSGKFGDIIWALPTARQLSRRHGAPVDFRIMPTYRSLLPLLRYQNDYIASAEVIEDWACTGGSPHSDQPWQPPHYIEQGYDLVAHLTPRRHVGTNGAPMLPLAHFMAWQQNITLPEPIVPFLKAPVYEAEEPFVCYGFNESQRDLKDRLIARLCLQLRVMDVSKLPWLEAASRITASGYFIGCRSACWVMAMGLGAVTWTYEPNPSRNAFGYWGMAFGLPTGKETPCPFDMSPRNGR